MPPVNGCFRVDPPPPTGEINHLPFMSLRERASWANIATTPEENNKRKVTLSIQTAMGNGTIEERLLRLMAWTGARLHATDVHTTLRDPFKVLADGRAWCDQQTKVFLFFAWHLTGIIGRELALLHQDGFSGHTVVELWYEGVWRLFDVHTEHQAVYRATRSGPILGYRELCQNPTPVLAEQHWWRGRDGAGKEGFYAPPFDVTYNAPVNQQVCMGFDH